MCAHATLTRGRRRGGSYSFSSSLICTAHGLPPPLVRFLPLGQVLEEIRPYLVGTGGGELMCKGVDGVIVKVAITGPAAKVMTVRVAVTQKLREKIPGIAAVQLV